MESQLADTSSEKMIQSLAEIARDIARREHAREIHLKATHGRFNLFTTLLRAHDEVRLHTRYLVHLLDPTGPHDCGRLFLDHFLDVIQLPDLKKQACDFIANEHYTGGLGNIDIYLQFEESVVVIENKIWAGDQDKQLQRYAEYARSRRQTVYILYLTLDGHSPSENSRGFLENNEILLISYAEHVLPWINECLRNTVSLISINQALQQYKQVVNQLLGNTMEAQDMSQIKQLILENNEILKHEKQIIAAFKEIRRDRELEIQKKCQGVLGGGVKSWIWYWDTGTAFKFSCPAWGADEETDLTVLMSPEGAFSLIAYDVEGGRIKAIIDAGSYEGRWEPEKSYFYRKYLDNISLPEAQSTLEKIISLLK
jgi:hypothetical protein